MPCWMSIDKRQTSRKAIAMPALPPNADICVYWSSILFIGVRRQTTLASAAVIFAEIRKITLAPIAGNWAIYRLTIVVTFGADRSRRGHSRSRQSNWDVHKMQQARAKDFAPSLIYP
jgi:hypothetical protein